ncbi:hypothetical protein IQ216_03390 [Cyanobium sp. LEGE 06143]|nr:hypothetical protein [Cyanobium sp. LEGE 06143]MBE9172157.1 hypothetical protein [Cyanobium sp. LEGE 06143]
MTTARPFVKRLFPPSRLLEEMPFVDKTYLSSIGSVIPQSQLKEFTQ